MDSTLTRYLIGDLPQEEIDALDERSIVDAEFAERLRAAEHDLADAYHRGELSADERVKWERGPGASIQGHEQLRLARALQVREQVHRPDAMRAVSPRRWALAAAAVVAVAAATVYVLRSERPAQRPDASAHVSPTPAAPSVPAPAISFVAVTLPIPTRSVQEPPVLVIPPGTQQVRITLQLEPSEFTRFSVALLDLGTKRVVWRADSLGADTGPRDRTVTADVPADFLRAGRSIFQLMGVTGNESELVGMYPLIVQRKT
jgi:hypothetical protein